MEGSWVRVETEKIRVPPGLGEEEEEDEVGCGCDWFEVRFDLFSSVSLYSRRGFHEYSEPIPKEGKELTRLTSNT